MQPWGPCQPHARSELGTRLTCPRPARRAHLDRDRRDRQRCPPVGLCHHRSPRQGAHRCHGGLGNRRRCTDRDPWGLPFGALASAPRRSDSAVRARTSSCGGEAGGPCPCHGDLGRSGSSHRPEAEHRRIRDTVTVTPGATRSPGPVIPLWRTPLRTPGSTTTVVPARGVRPEHPTCPGSLLGLAARVPNRSSQVCCR